MHSAKYLFPSQYTKFINLRYTHIILTGELLINIAYMYRIYPNSEQSKLIARTFGCVRKVYNLLLENSIKLYEQSKLGTGVFESQKPKTPASFKVDHEYLKEVDSLALANAQLNVKRAFKNFHNNPSIGCN